MPKYEIHTVEPGMIVEPPHPGGILQIMYECYPAHQVLGEFATDEEAKAAARELQAKHDAEAMRRVKMMGFVMLREPADLAPHRPVYLELIYRGGEDGFERVVES